MGSSSRELSRVMLMFSLWAEAWIAEYEFVKMQCICFLALHNKLPQTLRLETTRIYYLIVFVSWKFTHN